MVNSKAVSGDKVSNRTKQFNAKESSLFGKFVQLGRLVNFTYGPYEGKVATIIDIVDHRRVVVDGPQDVTGVPRHVCPIRWFSMTDIVTTVQRNGSAASIKKSLAKNNTMRKWRKSALALKVKARSFRKNLTDFDRFKLMIVKKRASHALRGEIKKLTHKTKGAASPKKAKK